MTYAVKGIVQGHVQGVGFRYHLKQAVESTQIVGHALNLPDRTVEVLLIGTPEEIASVQSAAQEGPRYARVDSINWEEVETHLIETLAIEGFRIG